MKTLLETACAALLFAGVAGVAHAGDISLEHPWSRAAPKGAPVGAGYVTLKNGGAAADKLISATADVAGRVEIHEMTMDNGVMKMRPVNGLEIPAGKSVELKPGGYHIMFMQLKKPLVAGETVKSVLTFEKAGAVPVEFKIEAMNAGAAGMPGHKGH
ncbi:MAG: copper chaperone PCu(A)C [Rhodoblastus sp.]|nr:copper chaperone PCu(A)C [Rhodoblastus sp.]